MDKNKKDRQEAVVFLKCDCGCAAFVVERMEEGGEISYNISVQDSRYDCKNGTFWGRLKGAFRILFGKSVRYNDVYIDEPERFKKFLNELKALCQND